MGSVLMMAWRTGNIVLMTGETDYLSDGKRTMAISNGHGILGQVTGVSSSSPSPSPYASSIINTTSVQTGCLTGAISAGFLAVHKEDKLLAVLSGLLMLELAAERAVAKEHVRGPGSFVPALLDELWAMREMSFKEEQHENLIKGAKVCEITDI